MADDNLPILPLPSVVLSPSMRIQPHVFEPRYRRMLEDTLSGRGRMGMALLREGWEKDYHGAPETYRAGSHGRATDVERLEDGRHDVILDDTRRFESVEFVQSDPYCLARVRALPEEPPPPSPVGRAQLEALARLHAALARPLGDVPAPQFRPERSPEFERHVNGLAMSLRVPPALRQDLLEAARAG